MEKIARQDIGTAKKIIAAACSVANAILFSILYWVLPQFKETFEAFGTKLPALTRIFLSAHPAYVVLAIISILPIFMFFTKILSLKHQLLVFKVVVLSSIIAIILFGFVIVAMYLPIFILGNTAA